MIRRYIFVKLKPEIKDGLKLLQVLKTANEVLSAAHLVQGVYVGHAVDDATRQSWDICFTLEYVSHVDLERSMNDPITRSFVSNFLTPRAEKVEMASFSDERT